LYLGTYGFNFFGCRINDKTTQKKKELKLARALFFSAFKSRVDWTQLQLLQMKINIIIHVDHLSAAFLKLYVESSDTGSGNAKLSTAFDVIHRFVLLCIFAWDMPEIGFVGTAVSMCDTKFSSLHLRAGSTLQLGLGNLAGLPFGEYEETDLDYDLDSYPVSRTRAGRALRIGELQVVSGIQTCFCMYYFLDDHNFINNHPADLKLVPNDAPCDLIQSALKTRLYM
jgi:hypothetical protein